MKLKEVKKSIVEHKKGLIMLGCLTVGTVLVRPAAHKVGNYTLKENLGTAIGCIGLGMYISEIMDEWDESAS